MNIDEQIACVKREIGMRHRVYPRWTSDGKMTAEKAAHEIAAMEAVLATLVKVKADTDPQKGFF